MIVQLAVFEDIYFQGKTKNKILIDKLAHYDVVGNAHAWFVSCLCGHQQAVMCDGSQSTGGSVRVGVPQVSILGPLLCSILCE